jgi:cytochrome c-type biogenesis protein
VNYLISFLEGIITFISPCLLPMLPLYLSYFAGQNHEGKKKATITHAIGFVLGFTFVFVLLGAFAGTIGGFLQDHKTIVNLVSGLVVILFGLNYLGVIRIPYLNNNRQVQMKLFEPGFFASVSFGLIFAVGWTPCVGAFLGSALMLAASSGESLQGILMLLSFSLGLGIPFIASAILIDRLKSTFAFIKKNYRIINLISGGLLVVVGLLMALGLMGYYLSLLTF